MSVVILLLRHLNCRKS